MILWNIHLVFEELDNMSKSEWIEKVEKQLKKKQILTKIVDKIKIYHLDFSHYIKCDLEKLNVDELNGIYQKLINDIIEHPLIFE